MPDVLVERGIGRANGVSRGAAEPFRVGVTGTRRLSPDALPGLRTASADALRVIRDVLPISAPVPRLLSPLAEGADRLVAEVALTLGYVLEVALPFEQAEYERDFPTTVDVFRTLLAHAGQQVVALPGRRGCDEDESYEAVGRHVVACADLLIAVWNGLPARGRGGTGDIVYASVEHDLPVWWIPDDGRHAPGLLTATVPLQPLAQNADALAAAVRARFAEKGELRREKEV